MPIQYDIYKAAGLIIKDRRLLLSRNKGKDIFIAPGGKIETGETPIDALIRELKEEQGIAVKPGDLKLMGVYHAVAAGYEAEQLQLEMVVYFVETYAGNVSPQAEIAENVWYDSSMAGTVKQGSIFEHEVIPQLLEQDLID